MRPGRPRAFSSTSSRAWSSRCSWARPSWPPLLGDALEAAAIALVLVINATIGFIVELRARRAMDALLHYEAVRARVVRGGRDLEVPAATLVPGDVVKIEEGDAVPADLRLLDSSGLTINEAPLTGESIPVEKDPRALTGDTLLADRRSMAYTGTSATSGRGTAVVVATGRETELGRIGTLLTEVEADKTPLEERLDALGHRLVWLALAVAAVVTLLGLLRGAPVGLMLETGIALAIAAVPEGLPAVVTIALAVGLRRMAARHALVRRLVAVEALGATTIVCTDKTGTLTTGQMTVREVATTDALVSVSGDGYATEGTFASDDTAIEADDDPWLSRLLLACALTSRATLAPDGEAPLGDPTDAALLVLAMKGGVDADRARADLPQVDDVPFTSARRYSASIHSRAGGRLVFVKGAPAAVLDRCTDWVGRAGEQTLRDPERQALLSRNEDLAGRGLRVIALASGPDPDRLTLLGMVGIVDPPARAVPETIATLDRAGIRTVMATGDQSATAAAIAGAIGLGAGESRVLDGHDLRKLDDHELLEALADVDVFSRVSPEDKLRIVSALRDRGDDRGHDR